MVHTAYRDDYGYSPDHPIQVTPKQSIPVTLPGGVTGGRTELRDSIAQHAAGLPSRDEGVRDLSIIVLSRINVIIWDVIRSRKSLFERRLSVYQ